VQFHEILEFWFGSNPDEAAVPQEKAALWWGKSAAADLEIRQRFGALLHQAAAGELCEWQAMPRGRLALILLTDQFPRSVYRGSPQAFAYDGHALAWCLGGIEERLDLRLRPIERVFFYLPLEHAESLERQQQSVKLFSELVGLVAPEQKETFEEYHNFAVRHRDIIARFGRFPHRNRILGRTSTPEELAFLNEPGSSF
jgi:uncharacterized protein (DUF924 family)